MNTHETQQQQLEKMVGPAIRALHGQRDFLSEASGEIIGKLLQQYGNSTHAFIEGMRSLGAILEEQRITLAEALSVREQADSPVPRDSRELLTELLDLVREAHSRWSPADQSANPELGNRLEKYALLKLPKAGMLQQLARVNILRTDVMAGAAGTLEGEPQYTLDVQLDQESGQLFVSVAPAGAETPEQTEDQPQIMVAVEINNGLPCAHVYGDIYGDCALSLFGRPGARLASRPGDAQVDHEDSTYAPDVQEVIASTGAAGTRKEAATERMR